MIRERPHEFAELSLERCCRASGVHRSLLYRSCLRDKDARLVQKIRALHERFPSYGYRRVAVALGISEKLARGVMRRQGLAGLHRRKQKQTTIPAAVPDGANLLPNLDIRGPERVFASDVTYIRVLAGRWIYLATVLDIFTRQVVGWALSSRNDTDLTKNALSGLLTTRTLMSGWVHHSDRGCNYAALAYQSLVERFGGLCSFSDKASPTQNSYAESFFSTLKLEQREQRYQNLEHAKLCLSCYFQIYNQERIHSSLGNKPPDQFYAESMMALK